MIDACTMARRFRASRVELSGFSNFSSDSCACFSGVNNENEQQPPHPQQDSTREAENVNCLDDYRQSITRLDA